MAQFEGLSRADARQLERIVRNMIVRGEIASVDDALKMQELGVRLEDGHRPTKVEHWHPYGITYHPFPGSEIVALAIKGNRDHVVIIPAADRRYRLKNLAEGELAVHDDQGQKVHFTRGGLVVETPKPVTIKGQTITLDGPVHITGQVTTDAGITSAGAHVASAHV